MKISNKYDRLIRKLTVGKSSPGEAEELARWNVVKTEMRKQLDAARNIVDDDAVESRIQNKVNSKCQTPSERKQRL